MVMLVETEVEIRKLMSSVSSLSNYLMVHTRNEDIDLDLSNLQKAYEALKQFSNELVNSNGYREERSERFV
jgi:hypothetical protein